MTLPPMPAMDHGIIQDQDEQNDEEEEEENDTPSVQMNVALGIFEDKNQQPALIQDMNDTTTTTTATNTIPTSKPELIMPQDALQQKYLEDAAFLNVVHALYGTGKLSDDDEDNDDDDDEDEDMDD